MRSVVRSVTTLPVAWVRRMSGLSRIDYPGEDVCPRDLAAGDEFASAAAAGGKVRVPDPYRWLEEESSPKTTAWVDAQVGLWDKFKKDHLQTLSESLQETLAKRWSYERYSCPYKRGKRYVFYHNSGLQNHSVLYGKDSLDDEKYVMIDPNTLSEDGTTALSQLRFSEDGSMFAFALSKSGSDWRTIHVKDSETRSDLTDKLEWVKYSTIDWLHDNSGFFYCRFPAIKKLEDDEKTGDKKGTETDSAKGQRVFFHKIGTSQDEDQQVFFLESKPDWLYSPEVSDCGRYLLLGVSESTDPENMLYVLDMEESKDLSKSQSLGHFKLVVDDFKAQYSYITNEGSEFWFLSNFEATNKKVIRMDIRTKEVVDVIKESDRVINSVVCVDGDKLLVSSTKDVKEGLALYNLKGEFLHQIVETGILQISGIGGRKKDKEFFYQTTSFLEPGAIFRFDMELLKSTPFLKTVVPGFVPENFLVEQVFYSSKDGTRVPMFIMRHKDSKLDGNNRTLLYGYGGFGIAMLPSFSVTRWTMLERFKGVYAVANLRGGDEYGRSWHRAGTLLQKQNVFDDFIAAGEYLVQNKYTNPKKLAIQGGSNGGLLVGACTLQRPDLFGSVICQVGVLDMLRFHRFTIGHFWTNDYGNADRDPSHFDALIKYSPYHNVRLADSVTPYPSMLICTADHDDRVVPLHSFKFAAELQYQALLRRKNEKLKDLTEYPLLMRIERKAGHGAGKPLKKVIEETADVIAFLEVTLQ